MPISELEIDRRWEDAAQLLQFSQAETVRTAAQTWTGYITAFLGVVGFAGVTFVPAEIKDVTGPARDAVLWLGVGVILLGLAALVFAALASGSVPVRVWNDGEAYRAHSKQSATTGIQQLRWSRGLTFAALACLLLAAALAAINPGKPTADSTTVSYALAIQSDGKVLCAETVTNKITGAVTIKGIAPNTGLSTLSIVDQCP